MYTKEGDNTKKESRKECTCDWTQSGNDRSWGLILSLEPPLNSELYTRQDILKENIIHTFSFSKLAMTLWLLYFQKFLIVQMQKKAQIIFCLHYFMCANSTAIYV